MDNSKDIEQLVISLYQTGVNRSTAGSFATARLAFGEALTLAKDYNLHPDYSRLPIAGTGYCDRQENARPRAANVQSLIDAINLQDPSEVKRYFGKARLNLEIGLVHRFDPEKQVGEHAYVDAFAAHDVAVFGYGLALANAANEIVSEEKIHDQLYRAMQSRAAMSSEAASKLPSGDKKRTAYLDTAVSHARSMIVRREQDGEVGTWNLMDAYHTLAVALAACEGPAAYQESQELFNETISRALTIEHNGVIGSNVVASVAYFKLAQLHNQRGVEPLIFEPMVLAGFGFARKEDGSWVLPDNLRTTMRPTVQDVAGVFSPRYDGLVERF